MLAYRVPFYVSVSGIMSSIAVRRRVCLGTRPAALARHVTTCMHIGSCRAARCPTWCCTLSAIAIARAVLRPRTCSDMVMRRTAAPNQRDGSVRLTAPGELALVCQVRGRARPRGGVRQLRGRYVHASPCTRQRLHAKRARASPARVWRRCASRARCNFTCNTGDPATITDAPLQLRDWRCADNRPSHT